MRIKRSNKVLKFIFVFIPRDVMQKLPLLPNRPIQSIAKTYPVFYLQPLVPDMTYNVFGGTLNVAQSQTYVQLLI